MWSDNETNQDFVNFRAVADTVAEIIVQAQGQALSIGVSGSWGVGKSSLIQLIQKSLGSREGQPFLVVNFNAWLYQGYDDARAALMDVIARSLLEHAQDNETLAKKAVGLIKRLHVVRNASLLGMIGASLALGIPLPGVVGTTWGAIKGLTDGSISEEDAVAAKAAGEKVRETGRGLIKNKPDTTPPKQIQELREHFEQLLAEMKVTLVVLIDDLDRCLPATAIATLEAIRHFLFLKRTAFVIAADDKMIRQAVRVHFKDVELDDDLVTNYFDKLIQIPVRVPPLGTQDVRAFLMLLFVENGISDGAERERIRAAVCKQLSESWQGKAVNSTFVRGLITDCPDALASQLALADRLAPLMTSSEKIAGNPRLIKRFLNTLYIRRTMARAQNVTVDESTLAKLLLFERCGTEEAYRQLVKSVNESDKGKPEFLQGWEQAASRGEEFKPDANWDDAFSRQWLALDPPFGEQDLRAAVYVSRDHLPVILATDQFSSDAAEVMESLLAVRSQASVQAGDQFKKLSTREKVMVFERLLQRAKNESVWGTPPILFACLTVTTIGEEQQQRFAQFLRDIPPTQLTPAFVPILADKAWATATLEYWSRQKDIPGPVKKAILNAVGKR